ncbi:hypothetical protein [Streptomyces sp. CRN 30]|uniref:hypothetical protein n=1 Tax=Streptomyces sp. CRN 30 TaxID=3075613 RepID=UPI002A82401A|nr:hypothetical protein [Streptomyces sp. CRN 30]
MAAITKITAEITTADVDEAGTDSWLYLGIAGREFVLDLAGASDADRGQGDTYVFGTDSNVEEAEYNDPRHPQLDTAAVARNPVYVRMEPEGSAPGWCLERATVVVNPGGEDSSTYDNEALVGGSKLWLGQSYGKIVYLDRWNA